MKDLIEATAWEAGGWWAERLDSAHDDKRKALSAAIMRRVDSALRDEGRIRLENDYDPRGELLEAVNEVGIECRGCFFSGDGIFPRKHVLTITPGKLEPKEGYGNWTDPILVLEVFPEDGSQPLGEPRGDAQRRATQNPQSLPDPGKGKL